MEKTNSHVATCTIPSFKRQNHLKSPHNRVRVNIHLLYRHGLQAQDVQFRGQDDLITHDVFHLRIQKAVHLVWVTG